jgi:hypothetical protein
MNCPATLTPALFTAFFFSSIVLSSENISLIPFEDTVLVELKQT